MTPVQARMARAALSLTVEDLSREAGVSAEEVAQMEQGGQEGIASARLRTTFEGAGVSFLDGDGVRFDARLGAAAKTVPLEEMNSYNDE